jgi:hypothetical protein
MATVNIKPLLDEAGFVAELQHFTNTHGARSARPWWAAAVIAAYIEVFAVIAECPAM